MYKYLRDPSRKNPNPVITSREVTATTSKQMKDYLLCSDCEELFNNRGEREVLKWVWNGTEFPLGNRLALAHWHYPFRGFPAFSGDAIGIDTEKFGYFALSVFWRAAVHKWEMPFGGTSSVVNLGTVQEPLRQYLHGDIPLPLELLIITTVCTDFISQRVFYAPSPVLKLPGTSFSMVTLGLQFMVYVGGDIPPILRQGCCMRSTHHLIFQRDCSQKVVEAWAELMKTSRATRKIE